MSDVMNEPQKLTSLSRMRKDTSTLLFSKSSSSSSFAVMSSSPSLINSGSQFCTIIIISTNPPKRPDSSHSLHIQVLLQCPCPAPSNHPINRIQHHQRCGTHQSHESATIGSLSIHSSPPRAMKVPYTQCAQDIR